MSRQAWNETMFWVTADGTAVASSASATAIFGNITIPANYMQDGRILRLRAFGKLSTTGTPTIKFGVYYGGTGGTLLAETEAITNGSGVTNVNWSVEVLVQVRTNGASGSLIAMGEAKIHTAAGTVLQNVFGVSGYDAPAAVSSLNLATDWNLTLAATWGTSSASNTLTGMVYSVESLN
jgi:hypothetical protein